MNEDVSSKSFSAKMSSSSCFFQGRYKCKDNDNYEEYLKLMSESQELALELMMSHAQIEELPIVIKKRPRMTASSATQGIKKMAAWQ